MVKSKYRTKQGKLWFATQAEADAFWNGLLYISIGQQLNEISQEPDTSERGGFYMNVSFDESVKMNNLPLKDGYEPRENRLIKFVHE